jgi:hypothetical protein
VFDRLRLRVSIANDVKTTELLAQMARDRFGLRADQLSVAKQSPGGASSAVEVLSPN